LKPNDGLKERINKMAKDFYPKGGSAKMEGRDDNDRYYFMVDEGHGS
jgi:hypothetical protein